MAEPSVKPFDPAGGRKWIAMWYLVALGVSVMVAVYLKSLVAPLHSLDIAALERIFGVMAGIVAAFMGINGYVTAKTAAPDEPVPTPGEGTLAPDPAVSPESAVEP